MTRFDTALSSVTHLGHLPPLLLELLIDGSRMQRQIWTGHCMFGSYVMILGLA